MPDSLHVDGADRNRLLVLPVPLKSLQPTANASLVLADRSSQILGAVAMQAMLAQEPHAERHNVSAITISDTARNAGTGRAQFDMLLVELVLQLVKRHLHGPGSSEITA